MTTIVEIPSPWNFDSKTVAKPDFQPHPLLIDHVVEKILLSLDQDLLGHYCKIFRLVCKQWRTIATKTYKNKRGKIVFKKNFIGKVSGLFIRIMRTSSHIPFQTFKFTPDSYDDVNFSELLHVCSGTISTLDLNFVNPTTLSFPVTLPPLMNNLKKLSFNVRLDCFEILQIEMASFLESLLKISPNLESFELKVIRGVARFPQNATLGQVALEKFADAFVKHLPDSVKDLKLHLTITDSQLRELTKRKLNLSSLDIYFQQSELSVSVLEEFFGKIAGRLLKCRVLGNQFQEKIDFPVFKQLKHLASMGQAPNYLSYEKLFPKLETLEISLWDSYEGAFPPNCYSSVLQAVILPHYISSPEIFTRLGQVFPNLKKLTGVTITTKEGLVAIFQSLKSLEFLEIILGYDFQSDVELDTVLIGGNDFSPVMKYCDETLKEEVKKKGTRDSIRNLKELRYLSISAAPLTMPSQVKLSDYAVYYGFLQLEKLSVIKLDYFPISPPCLENLQRNVILKRPI